MYIVYKNRFNEVKVYDAKITAEFESSIEILDLKSEKLKTFRRDRICLVHDNLAFAQEFAKEAQKEFTVIPRQGAYKLSQEEYDERYNKVEKSEICFTGFKKTRKDELSKIAIVAGLFVRKSVTANLSILVCGENVGPAKLKKAEAAGVKVLTEDEWLKLIG